MNWVNESIFYHIYPLGFCGAPQQNGQDAPVNRIGKLSGWIPHLRDIGPVLESSAQ